MIGIVTFQDNTCQSARWNISWGPSGIFSRSIVYKFQHSLNLALLQNTEYVTSTREKSRGIIAVTKKYWVLWRRENPPPNRRGKIDKNEQPTLAFQCPCMCCSISQDQSREVRDLESWCPRNSTPSANPMLTQLDICLQVSSDWNKAGGRCRHITSRQGESQSSCAPRPTLKGTGR